MTEKRFNDVKGYVYDKKNCIGFIQDDYTCENIINLLNTQHDALIKKGESLSKVLSVNSNYEKCLKGIDDVLSKHNIHTLEKLDQVLTNERTW